MIIVALNSKSSILQRIYLKNQSLQNIDFRDFISGQFVILKYAIYRTSYNFFENLVKLFGLQGLIAGWLYDLVLPYRSK